MILLTNVAGNDEEVAEGVSDAGSDAGNPTQKKGKKYNGMAQMKEHVSNFMKVSKIYIHFWHCCHILSWQNI